MASPVPIPHHGGTPSTPLIYDGEVIVDIDLVAVDINDPEAAATLFPVGSCWMNKTVLQECINKYSVKMGFEVCCNRDSITCNRAGSPRKKKIGGEYDHISPSMLVSTTTNGPTPRAYTNSAQMKVGCTWHVKVKCKSKKAFKPNVQRPRNRQDTTVSAVHIQSVCFDHKSPCEPSPQQLLMVRNRSGKYVSQISEYATWTLCSLLHVNQRLSSSTIKSILKRNFPTNKNITKHDVFNTRVRCKRLIPTYLQSNKDFQKFDTALKSSKLPQGIDSDTITDDEAVEMIHEIWSSMINDHEMEDSDEARLLCFSDYMRIIGSKAKGFTYRFATDDDGVCNGVVWMTATMRSNFERFGSYVSLDAMKRGLHKLNWPYIAITMLNDLKKVCVGCESIMVGEQDEAYEFVVKSTCEMAPLRSLHDIYVVAGDGFFSQGLLQKWGLTKAKFIADYYHLFDAVLAKHHRKSIFYHGKRIIYDLISVHLSRMAIHRVRAWRKL